MGDMGMVKRMTRYLQRLEENSVLTNVMTYSGLFAILAKLYGAGALAVVSIVICATAFIVDAVLCSIRITGELDLEDQAAKELVQGVYRIAKDHHVTQDDRRVIVYHTNEEI